MNRSELVEVVAERAGSDRAVARRHVDAVFDAIMDSVTAGDRVLVTGFGTFDRLARPARTARNPRTGQTIDVAAGDVPRFRVGQTFKNRVAAGGDGGPAGPARVVREPVVREGVQEGTAVTAEVEAPKKPKKTKKGKKAAKAPAAKKPGGKAGKKSGTGKKAAKAR